MWSLALSFLGRFAQPLMIAALVALGGLLLKSGWENAGLKRQLAKAEARAEDERTKRVQAENDLADLIRDYNEQARAADAREAALEKARVDERTRLEMEHAKRQDATRSALDIALNSLRNSPDADRRAALQPAGDTPADCRNYAADPRNLSLPDAELLARIGAAAEGVAGRLAYCDGYLKRVVPRPAGGG